MNKNCYRVIFSQARGLFIAVAEIVKSQTKQTGQTSASTSADTVAVTVSPIHYKKLNPLNFAVIGCLGALVISLPMSTVADTQIIADKSAPTSQQATILNSANGTTQVNIQTPSAGGVSRNTYTQFDVGQEGAILNNSRNNTQTQIGGWVQGNPWLAKGEAKVILNEVNSSNPSQLKGYIEVAGKQAQVVIANPSGLVCDGCGVINADRFTLTTGQAVMNQGYLESFRVREGQVTIDGKGLNGSLTPFTDIYTRALKVNAGLYANELNTVLGQNDIQVKDQVAPQITATTDATSAPISNFALDVGQLGGMYAGKIFLVGTEQGLGVRNAGTINSTQGMLSLNANGDLVNTGNVIANKDQVQLKAQNVQNTGNVSSATSQISVESQNLDNAGLISSADELHLNQQNRLNNSGTLNAARVVIDATSLKNSGSIEQTGTQGLDLKSGSMTNLGGKIGIAKNTTGSGTGGSTGGTGSVTAPSNPAQDGGSLEVATPIDTTPKTYDQGYIHVKDQLNNDQGTIIANGGVDVESQNGLDNQGGQLNLGHVKIQGERFNNDQGQLTVKQAEIQTNTLSNQSGQLISNQKLNIQTQTTNNQKGKIQSVDQLDLNVVNSLDNTEGQIASGQQLNIQADQVNNQSGLIYSEQQGIELKANQVINNTSGIIQAKTQLNLASAQLDNTSGHIQAENIQQQHITVNNIQGSIVAGQSFISTVDQFDNHQGLIDTNNGQLTHQVLNNSGSIYADQNIKITGQHILNTGSIAAGQNIQLNTAKLQHEQAALIAAGLDRQGKLTNTGDLDITADQTALDGKSFAGQHLKVASKQQIDATNGQLQAKNINLASDTGDISTRAATVIAEQLSLKSHDLIDNQQGTLSAQYLNLTANRLDNSKGHILHTGQDLLDLNFSQSLNNQSGEIRSNAADLNIKTTLLNNTEGQVVHAGINQLNIQTAQLNGHLGQILSNGALQFKGGTLDVSGGVTSADQIVIQANELNNTQGQLIQRGTSNPLNLVIQQQLNNQAGLIQSATATNIKAGSLNNQGGTLSSAQGQNLDVDVGGKLDNSQSGQIYAGNQAHLQVGSLDNSNQGEINAQQNLQLTSQQQINNQLGQIVANGDVQIQSQGLDNSHGQIGSVKGGLLLDAGQGVLLNQLGSLQAAKDIQLTADQLNSQSGLINAQGAIQVNIHKDIDNSSGQIIANQAVQLNSQGLNNNSGQIGSVEDILSIDTGQGVLSNQQGKLQSTKDLSLKAQGIDNQSGLIATQAQLNTQQQWLNNNKGQMISGKTLNLSGQDLSNQGGVLQSGQDLNFKLSGTLDNSQSGQLISAGNTQIEAKQLDNSQQSLINAQSDINITTQQGIDNAAGSIVAKNNVQLSSQGLNNNQGQIGTELGDLNIQTGQQALDNLAGQIQSGKTLSINSNSLNNSGVISALNTLELHSQNKINNDHGQIAANAQLNITANQLSNQSGTIQTGDQANLNLNLTGDLNNQSGQIHSGTDQQITAQQIDNSVQGQITAKGELNVQSQSDINNQTGQLIANGAVELKGQGINNNQGQIGSLQDQLSLDAGQGRFSNQSGNVQAKKDISLTAKRIDNPQGQLNSQGKTELSSQQDINNLEGLIAADLGLTLNSQGLNNNQGQIGSSQSEVTLNAGNAILSNQAGVILSGKALSLTADQLDNSDQGRINSQNNLDITTTNDINNNSGVIAANQQLQLNSQGLNNNAGQIGSVQDNVLIDTGSQLLNNQQGTIQSGQDLHLSATGLDNTQGQISSKQQLQLDSRGQLLNNHQGTLSAENLKIDSGKLNNDQGLIQAQQSIQIDTHQQDLINTHSGQQGGILSQGDIQLNHIQTLNNSQGYLASGKQLDLQANQVSNQQGTLLATTQLNLQGTGQNSVLNNQSGQLLSMGGMTLNIDQINNNGKANTADADSHITAAGELKISTQQLDNQNTLNTDPANASIQGIDTNTLNITSNVLNNQSGAIRSSANQNLNIQQLLNNQSGQISSEKQLTIQGDPLVIDNLGGQILAGTGLNLSAKSLSGDGKVLSLGNAILSLQNDYVHNANAQLQANQDLSLNTQGNITNNGTINAGNQLAFNAANINNNQNGKIESHDTRLTAQNNLNNSGLINGDNTRLQADTLNNEGTGRIYGTTLAIQANTLNNRPNSVGVAPVIASRGDMHLGVQTLNNLANTADYASQAVIFSNNNLYLGGSLDANDHATGQAQVINNESATIESLGDMHLSAKRINNINKNFKTDNDFEVSRIDGLEKYCDAWCTFDGVYYDGNPKEDWMKYQYSEITYETRMTESAPGQIKAGGNLDLGGAQVFNDKSQILADGELKNEGGSIESGTNIPGIRKVVDKGTQIKYWKYEGQWNNPFEVSSETTFDLNISQALGNQSLNQNQISTTVVSNNQSGDKAPAGQILQQNVNGLKDSNHSTQVGQAQNAQGQNLNVADTSSASNHSSTQTGQHNQPSQQSKNITVAVEQNTQLQGNRADQAHAKATTDQANAPEQAADSTEYEIRSLTSTEVKVPNSALYKVNADSKAGYLIETDPAFADYKKWLSSDYMLDALGLDPALQQKRLGDGFYEQRLVQDQIANLTGYRFLEGFANDDAQYKALMNNGITFAKLYGLRPGIALTAAQTAQLTSDIVWLVEQNVTLLNGTTTQALVPQVYVKARVGDLKGDGTLLSGNSVNLKLDGDLINGATIAGREAVQITADNVQNLNGRIQGNQVAIETQKDLNNIGGQIIAKDTMALKVGGNLNVESTTRTSESQVGSFSASITNLDRVAGLYVGNGSTKQLDPKQATLMLNVAGNSSLKGAQINNSNGATVLNTTGNVDHGTVSVGKQETLKINDKNGYQQKQQQDVGSQINSAGSLLINGQNINIKGSELSSEQGTTQVSAIDHLNIEEGRKTSDMESQWSSKSKGVLGSTKKTSYFHNQSDEAIASSITGKNVVLNANNIDIRGSNVVSDELTHIQAKQNVNITAAENYSSNESQQTKKKSGLTASFSDGVASVGYSKSSSDIKQQSSNVGLTQSLISSENGNTNIIAGQDLTTQAALLNAGKDLNLSAKNINLNAGYSSNQQQTESKTKQTGLSVGATYSPAMAGKSAYDKSMGDSQYSDSAVGQVMSQLNAVDKGMMAAQTPIVITGGNQKTQHSTNSSSSQAVVTEATAKGNLNIIAKGGSINSEGAKLSAEGDALLHATENITLGFAKDHQYQNAQSKQSGFSVDNRDWAAPAGVYNNQNQGVAKADQVTGTQLSAGGKATLQTEQGDINILGSSVVAQQDVTLNAARDINIKSTQSSQSQSENSTNKGVGSAQISDTEKFFGYMNGNNQSKSNSVEQQRSQVGSLEGNVNIQAGNNYTQQVADVVAKKDVNVTAKQIEVLQDVNSSNAEQSGKDLKVGVFAKVSSPILDLINTADKASKSKADDRTQALQVMATGAQGYQTYSDVKGSALFKAEAGIGFSSSSNQQNSQSNISQQNHIQAGGNVNLTSTEGNIHLQNTQVKAQDQINLDSAKNILLESGQNTDKADGKNSNAGLSVGYGVSVGAQTGAYIYGEAGYGKGSNHLDSTSQSNTTLNANQINIKSKGDTTLNGAQATANRIDTDVGGKLSIISQQDTIQQNNQQLGVGGRVQASLGTAWQASGNVSSSKASGSSNRVNQQSGLFAGEGGYHVKADSVDLKGGAISSTASKNNNDLTTNRLSFSNIENQSNYQATSVSLSGGMSGSKGKAGSDNNTTKAANPTSNENWRNATSFSPSLPQHQENKDNSNTYATLSEGNITIGGKATTAKALGIHSDINTANRQVDTLPNLQEILDKQKTVADATSTIAAATRTYAQNQVNNTVAEKEAIGKQLASQLSPEEQAKIQNMTGQEKDNYFAGNAAYDAALAKEKTVTSQWGMGGDKSRALNAVTMAVTGALGGQTDLQVAANTLAPYAAQQIGEKFGHGEDKNTVAQMVSHAILGAALAYVNNGNPAAGGSAAVASEAAAGYLAERYNDGKTAINPKTGQFDPNLLPEDAKTQIRDLTAAIGAVVGGTVGDSAFNAQLAGVVGQNAVENNIFGVVNKDGTFNKVLNNQFFQDFYACNGEALCEQKTISKNAEAAMKNVPKAVNVDPTKYKEGDIITSPGQGSGLYYIVLNDNGVMRAKLLPTEIQVSYSLEQTNNARTIVQRGALASPIANTAKSLHDLFADKTLFTKQDITVIDRVFAGLEVAGNVAMIGGSFISPKKPSTNNSAHTDNNFYRDDDLWSNKPSGKQEYTPAIRQKINQKDIEYLKNNSIKFNEKDLVSTIRAPDGKVVFLESGNEKAGLLHVLKAHQKDFENIGVKAENIPSVLMEAVKGGKIIGYQGKGTGRPIYETVINGEKRAIAISIGNNGFIVGANPTRVIK
ncbi:hemagglutinin repeat-containing protein [uncultured Acinetobacter sp.]|uniref:hemagglutinin repeat-containing protein n=1 Tax=uncultured Acinetobacter sp. TaxID=165433 RepID=UPI00338EE5D6